MKEEDISENDVVRDVGAVAVSDDNANDNRDDDRFAMMSVSPRAEALGLWSGECSTAECSNITSSEYIYVGLKIETFLSNNDVCFTKIMDLPHLQTIRLVHCRKFADLNLRTMMLSSILVSNCPALHRINITSNSLQKLALQKQDSLTTLALQCQSLQEVDLSECESLTNFICDVFSDVGGCPMLKSLVLANCEDELKKHMVQAESSGDSHTTTHDYTNWKNDIYSKVKGPEKRGYVRCLGKLPPTKDSNTSSQSFIGEQRIQKLEKVLGNLLSFLQARFSGDQEIHDIIQVVNQEMPNVGSDQNDSNGNVQTTTSGNNTL